MSSKKVLITGASGYVGTRLAERLVLGEGDRITALIHQFSSPGVARLARLPIELVVADVLDEKRLSSLAKGCDIIIHLAYGTRGDPIEKKRTTVLGTENVLKAALETNVTKVIHLSTASVHGLHPKERCIDESASFEETREPYRSGKIGAEKVVEEYRRKHGLPVVILRPPLVYGPYGKDWTVRIVNEIKKGTILVNGGRGAANLIYIDNLIDAILLAMEKKSGEGETFMAVDDEHLTWKDVYEAYAQMIGFHPPIKHMTVEEIESSRKEERRGNGAKEWFIEPLLLIPEAARACLHSAEFIDKTMQIPWLKFLKEKIPRWILDRMKNSGKEQENGAADRVNFQLPSKDTVKLYSSEARFSNEKIKRILGYKQRISFNTAMGLTRQWLRYQRLIP